VSETEQWLLAERRRSAQACEEVERLRTEIQNASGLLKEQEDKYYQSRVDLLQILQ
jgi:hypothetical protein